VLYVEREAFAAAYLVGEMAEGRMDEAPVWSDLGLLGFEELDRVLELAGPVVVTAGFPCTPWSTAGQRRGIEDDRWIWDEIARILRHLRPGLVVLECTPGVTSGGLEHVLGTLAEIGLDAEWDCISAADVGASHQRERWWCVGISARALELLSNADGQLLREQPRRSGGADGASPEEPGDLGPGMANAGGLADGDGEGLEAWGSQIGGQGADAFDSDRGMADPDGRRFPRVGRPDGGGDGQPPSGSDPNGRYQGLGSFPPGPDDREQWRRILAARPELAPALTREAEGEAVRALRSMAHGLVAAERTDMIRLLGNGVVPQCAEAAICELLNRFAAPATPTEGKK
jgi:DNA (cytosine-5)-methyltransferase 1